MSTNNEFRTLEAFHGNLAGLMNDDHLQYYTGNTMAPMAPMASMPDWNIQSLLNTEALVNLCEQLLLEDPQNEELHRVVISALRLRKDMRSQPKDYIDLDNLKQQLNKLASIQNKKSSVRYTSNTTADFDQIFGEIIGKGTLGNTHIQSGGSTGTISPGTNSSSSVPF